MRHVFLAAAAVTALAAGAAFAATPLEDAKAGLAALDKGENITAIRLFTTAIDSHKLARSDQELAFVKRSEAYLASHQEKSALADANHALDLQPGDSEASAARDRALALLTPLPTPASTPVGADPAADKASYDASVAAYDAERKAAADGYAKQMADYDAQVKAENDRHAAELATWQEDVKACKAGMLSKCGNQSPKPETAKAEPAKPTAPKVEPVKTAPKPAPSAAPATPQKIADQTATKVPPKPVKKPAPEPQRPAIY